MSEPLFPKKAMRRVVAAKVAYLTKRGEPVMDLTLECGHIVIADQRPKYVRRACWTCWKEPKP